MDWDIFQIKRNTLHIRQNWFRVKLISRQIARPVQVNLSVRCAGRFVLPFRGDRKFLLHVAMFKQVSSKDRKLSISWYLACVLLKLLFLFSVSKFVEKYSGHEFWQIRNELWSFLLESAINFDFFSLSIFLLHHSSIQTLHFQATCWHLCKWRVTMCASMHASFVLCHSAAKVADSAHADNVRYDRWLDIVILFQSRYRSSDIVCDHVECRLWASVHDNS